MELEGLSVVCAGLGQIPQDPSGKQVGKFRKGKNCFENLKDLQRFLRRDNPQTRDAFKQICKWNVVGNSLIPIIVYYGEETDLVVNSVKVLVFLSTPIDMSLGENHDIPLQLDYLWNIKASFLCNDAIAVIVTLLEEPLEHLECGSSGEDDWKIIQLVLTLFRNLLAIKDPIPQQITEKSESHFTSLKDAFLEQLFHENVMDLILALSQHVSDAHGFLKQDNLLFLEIFHSIFCGQRPELVATMQEQVQEEGMRRSSGHLKSIMEEEEEQKRLSRLTDLSRHSLFCGTFVKIGKDGSKKIIKRNPFITPAENILKGNQIKKGRVKHIPCDMNPSVSSTSRSLELLQKFADQFLHSGYNVLMQSVGKDIREEHPTIQNSDIIVFFELAQFFTAYQYHRVQFQKAKKGKIEVMQNGKGNSVGIQGFVCGPIASTMNEAMFNMVISKWHSSFEALKVTRDSKSLARAGSLLKEMIHMLDLVVKMAHDDTMEVKQEARTARVLLYKLFYDQTEKGIIHLLFVLLKSFDSRKQPQSHLADLVEMTHIVLRLIEGLKETDGTFRVLKKSRKMKKKVKRPDDNAKSSHGDGDIAMQETAEDIIKETHDAHRMDSPEEKHDKPNPEIRQDDGLSHNNSTTNNVDEPDPDQELMEDENDAEKFENDDESDFEDDSRAVKEANLDVQKIVSTFADNTVVCNYCWLLGFYKSNSAAMNHYIIQMLQRICGDLILAPMLYQLSLFNIFYKILSDPKTLQSKEYRNIVKFLSRLLHTFFQKLKEQPLLAVEVLFWKTRKECHAITAEKLLSDMKNFKKRSLADALGDDEADDINGWEPLNGNNKRNLSDALGEDEADFSPAEVDCIRKNPSEGLIRSPKRRNVRIFSDEQEAQIEELFERYKGNRSCSHMIAKALDSNGKISAVQVSRKLKQLGLKITPLKKRISSSLEDFNVSDDASRQDTEDNVERSMLFQASEQANRKRRIMDSDDESENRTEAHNLSGNSENDPTPVNHKVDKPRKKMTKFAISEEQESLIKELFEQNRDNKNCCRLIAESLDLPVSDVNRKLKALGLKNSHKPKLKVADPNNGNPFTAEQENEVSDTEALMKKSSGERDSSKKRKRTRIDEAQVRHLKELFEQHKENMKCSRIIAEALDLSISQVNHRLKVLGLKSSSRKRQDVSPKVFVNENDESDTETLTVKLSRIQSSNAKQSMPEDSNKLAKDYLNSDEHANPLIATTVAVDDEDSDSELLCTRIKRIKESGGYPKLKNRDSDSVKAREDGTIIISDQAGLGDQPLKLELNKTNNMEADASIVANKISDTAGVQKSNTIRMEEDDLDDLPLRFALLKRKTVAAKDMEGKIIK